MLFSNLQYHRTRHSRHRPPRRQTERRCSLRFTLEQLEDRMVPSNFTAATVPQLIADINAANLAGGSNTIVLIPGKIFTLTAADNTTDGANGLPVIAANDNLTIFGNGDTIARSTAPGTAAFRLFDVDGPLALKHLTLANGLATAPTETGPFGPVVLGGGILNTGAHLTLSDVTLDNNQVGAPDNTNAAGGGIASVFGAALTVVHSTFIDNRAIGPTAGAGDSFGGGIFNDQGSTLTVTQTALTGNQATQGGIHGSFGGAIANAGGSQATVSQSGFAANLARGRDGADCVGPGQNGATASDGGGSAIVSLSNGLLGAPAGATLTVTYSAFTGNQATEGGIHGSFGGAIANAGGSQATVSHSSFSANLARGRDGADGGPGQNGARASDGGGAAIVSLSNGLLGAPAGATLAVTYSTFTGNQALGGKGGDGGAGGNGGSGGQGEGAVFTILAGSSTTVTGSLFADNQSFGGRGGDGDGGRGGGGGVAAGSVEVASASLTVTSSTFIDNQALGGTGGNGVAGGNGGQGAGAAIASSTEVISPGALPTLLVSHSTFADNRAVGGAGGSGGGGGLGVGGGISAGFGTMNVSDSAFFGNEAIGGAGANRFPAGLAVGGGIVCGTPFNPNSTGFVTDCLLVGNVAQGGPGTPGSDGGSALGGGIVNGIGALTVSGTTLIANQAIGGAGGVGGNGGNAQGGGLFNQGTATVIHSIIVGNAAEGGAAGSGGTAGLGIGGGIFNVGTIFIDPLTVIFGNKADLFPDCFGC